MAPEQFQIPDTYEVIATTVCIEYDAGVTCTLNHGATFTTSAERAFQEAELYVPVDASIVARLIAEQRIRPATGMVFEGDE